MSFHPDAVLGRDDLADPAKIARAHLARQITITTTDPGEDALIRPRCGTYGGHDRLPFLRKDSQPRKRNLHPIRCAACNYLCPPAYAAISRSPDGSWSGHC